MGKTVLITGGSRGIGKELVRQFNKAGYAVAFSYLEHQEEAVRLANSINNRSGLFRTDAVVPIKADVSDAAQVKKMFEYIEGSFGAGVDILINNAGIAQQKLFTDLTEEDWDRMFDVDVKGVFHCCQCALPRMIRRQQGKIINISSMWGQVGASCEVHYSAAKAAVIGLTKALAKELGPSQIQVNCIAPGVIDTDMNAAFDEETMQSLRDETPLGRIGTPKDISKAALFLASEQSDFITGQVLGVNGGMIV